MLEILQFIFSSFWIWLGTVILVHAIGEGIEGAIVAITTRRVVQVNSGEQRREIES